MSDYGLPEPDHEPLAAHPSVSADFLTKAGSGDIHMLPEIASLSGRTVTLVDGSSVEADVIICATGYEMSFPFFDPDDVELHPDSDHRYPLFKRMIKPGVDHLFFMGLAQSSPTIVNLAEQQSKLLAALLDRHLRAAVGGRAGGDHARRRGLPPRAVLRHAPAHDPDRLRPLLRRPDEGARGGRGSGPDRHGG